MHYLNLEILKLANYTVNILSKQDRLLAAGIPLKEREKAYGTVHDARI